MFIVISFELLLFVRTFLRTLDVSIAPSLIKVTTTKTQLPSLSSFQTWTNVNQIMVVVNKIVRINQGRSNVHVGKDMYYTMGRNARVCIVQDKCLNLRKTTY